MSHLRETASPSPSRLVLEMGLWKRQRLGTDQNSALPLSRVRAHGEHPAWISYPSQTLLPAWDLPGVLSLFCHRDKPVRDLPFFTVGGGVDHLRLDKELGIYLQTSIVKGICQCRDSSRRGIFSREWLSAVGICCLRTLCVQRGAVLCHGQLRRVCRTGGL